MNPEIYIILCAVLGALLFALGGTDINGRGYKFFRRELLPVLWALLAFSAGIELWRCVAMAVLFDVAFRLPYGDKTPMWLKFVVFMALPLPSLLLGFNWWQLISGAICFVMFILSNWKPTERIMEWCVACLIIGSAIGICVGKLIAQTL